ncbi:MAG: hypothetical protein L0215_19360 [Gemmataceae bacterium]|nr:hypothetical protein [Gemmataceae bacterium]
MPAPTVTITQPPQNGPVLVLPFTVQGTTTANGGDAVTSMFFELDDLGARPIAAPFNNWSFELNSSNCGAGDHSLIVTASNTSETGEAARTITVGGSPGGG